MKAFISYSLIDSEHYILTLLAGELRKRGIVITQSNDFNATMSEMTKTNIRKSQLFIGLITEYSLENQRVIDEWKIASKNKIPGILLIEDTVSVQLNESTYIKFSRHYPEAAIKKLNEKIDNYKRKKEQDSKTAAWILGGAALLAIIGLLSDDD